MKLKLKSLMVTRAFYNVELGREDLTERERDKYLKAKKLIWYSYKKLRNHILVVYFLVSDAANYITGQVINVDGGMVM